MFSINQLCVLSARRILTDSKSSSFFSTSYIKNLFYNSDHHNSTNKNVLSHRKYEQKSYNICEATNAPTLIQILSRSTSFFNRVSAQQLWKGVTGVSNAGRKRGRGKAGRRMRIRDLNRGQFLGSGKINMAWPGLNKPIILGQRVVEQQTLPTDPDRMEKIYKMRDKMGTFRPMKLDPMERGWAGIRLGGKSIGPPDPVGSEKFLGFNTKILESKQVSTMDGNLGRKRRNSLFVVTGNGNGIGGFSLVKANLVRDAMRRAKNRAGQRLVYIKRCEGHTVYHDFFSQFLRTKLFVSRKPPGYGLVCHRAIKAICEVIGIKDLHAKVEGSINVRNMTKAFFLGLLQQQTHEDMANKKSLHVVKLAPGNYPKVVASPKNTTVRTREEIPYDEELDYTLYTMGGKVVKPKQRYQPFYERLPSYEKYLLKQVKKRNHDKIKHQLRLAHDGKLESFYTKDYPECCEFIYVKKEVEVEEEEEY